ncbi:MAG: hypothetical protein FJ256_02330 [Phycisphaerae bacterium]|nr:hypothetical protein [Phycisphaerae bacterium]
MNAARAMHGTRVRLAMTPMIDVVFLLLVFFVCTVRFERNEAVYTLDLPQRGRTADPLALQERALVIRVGARAGDAVPIDVQADGLRERPASLDALAATLMLVRRGAAPDAANAGLFVADHPVLIAPTSDCGWQDAVDAFNAAVRAGFRNIGFARSGA